MWPIDEIKGEYTTNSNVMDNVRRITILWWFSIFLISLGACFHLLSLIGIGIICCIFFTNLLTAFDVIQDLKHSGKSKIELKCLINSIFIFGMVLLIFFVLFFE